jgi:hypothetical protein
MQLKIPVSNTSPKKPCTVELALTHTPYGVMGGLRLWAMRGHLSEIFGLVDN